MIIFKDNCNLKTPEKSIFLANMFYLLWKIIFTVFNLDVHLNFKIKIQIIDILKLIYLIPIFFSYSQIFMSNKLESQLWHHQSSPCCCLLTSAKSLGLVCMHYILSISIIHTLFSYLGQ